MHNRAWPIAAKRFWLLGALALGAGLGACESPPAPASLKEWTPTDHHSSDDDKLQAGQQGAGNVGPAQRRSGADNVTQLVELTWRQQCINCHGAMGKGDGQMGPMLHAPDLTRPDWQKTVTDAELMTTIKNGKNRMPKFDVPEAVLQGLVKRIRSLQGS